jgi:uncharacterized protein (DUF983 family)
MLLRGALRRCAQCGGKGAFFTGFVARQDRCKTCGLKWDRNLEGFQLGAAAVNFIITGGAVLAAMGIGVVMTYPNISTWPLIAVVVSVALIVGIGGFPISYTVWLAVDLRMNPLDAEELTDADSHSER